MTDEKNFENLKDEILDKINNALVNKGKNNIICPICSHENHSIVDGFTREFVSDNLINYKIGGRNLPSTVIICKNCGYTMFFNLLVLGLDLEKENATK